MDTLTVNCRFPDDAVALSNATSGWDAVYAIKYSKLNDHIATSQNWMTVINDIGPGEFATGESASFISGTVTGLKIVRGGTGQELRFALSIRNAKIEDFSSTPNPPTGLFNLDVIVPVTLKFSTNPSPAGGDDGLKVLMVDVDQTIVPLSLPFSMVVSGTQQPDPFLLRSLVQVLLNTSSFKTLFAMDLAEVYHDEYARSVNIPWALPTAFSYAAADLDIPTGGGAVPDDHGVLAVLGSIDGDVEFLSPQINPKAIPIDSHINAVVILSTDLISRRTFAGALADQLKIDSIGDLQYDKALGALVNTKAVSAFYVKSDDGSIRLLDEAGVLNTTAEKFPAEIAAGAFRFRFENNSISVELDPVVVTIDGYQLILETKYSYQIGANGDDVDIFLLGEPVVTSRLVPPEVHTNFVATIVASAGGILAAEAIAFGFDRFFRLTSLGDTQNKLNKYVDDVVAANRKALESGEPVEISLGAFRKMIISTREIEPAGEYARITPEDRNAARLPRPKDFIGASERDMEMRPLVRRNRVVPADGGSATDLTIVDLNVSGLPDDIPPLNDRELVHLTRLRTATEKLRHHLNRIDKKISPRSIISGLEKTGPLFNEWSEIIDDRVRNSTFSDTQTKAIGALKKKIHSNFSIQRHIFDSLGIEEMELVYDSLVDVYERNLSSGNLEFTEYFTAILEMRRIALEAMDDAPFRNPYVYARRNGKNVKVPRSLLEAVRDELGERFTTAKKLTAVREFVQTFEAPLQVKMAGGALYLINLVVGQLAGGAVQDWVSQLVSRSSELSANKVDSDFNSSPENAKTLVNAVSFRLMNRRAGDPTAPAPSSVLQCAAVNGGLILGVSIS